MARRVSDAPIVQKDFNEFREVMAAKILGALNVDAATAGEPLEFFVMYASMAAFGIQGSPDYAFSAAWQNAFARFRDKLVEQGTRQGRTRSICWGQWTVDGAVQPDRLAERLERLRAVGMDLIDASDAIGLMEASLAGDTSVTAFIAVRDKEGVRRSLGLLTDPREAANPLTGAIGAYERGEWSVQDFAKYLDSVPDELISESIQNEIIRVIEVEDPDWNAKLAGERRKGHVDCNDNGNSGDTCAGPRPAAPLAQPLESGFVRKSILASVKKTLKLPENELNWDRPLQDYGLDSIIAMQLATTLEKNLKHPVQPRWLIEYPTLNQLMDKLKGELAGDRNRRATVNRD
jgi:aryl carrier-like protein